MPILEVRRHAERSDRGDEASALSARGRALCRELAPRCGPYALVVAGPAPRAQETAELLGGRAVDDSEDALAPGDVPTPEEFRALTTLAGYRALLRASPAARAFAEARLAAWAALARRAGDDEVVLAVSHGGVVDLVANLVAERVGRTLEGPTFGYCEGVRVRFRGGEVMALEVVRV